MKHEMKEPHPKMPQHKARKRPTGGKPQMPGGAMPNGNPQVPAGSPLKFAALMKQMAGQKE